MVGPDPTNVKVTLSADLVTRKVLVLIIGSAWIRVYLLPIASSSIS